MRPLNPTDADGIAFRTSCKEVRPGALGFRGAGGGYLGARTRALAGVRFQVGTLMAGTAFMCT
jgi:hypothetical protein